MKKRATYTDSLLRELCATRPPEEAADIVRQSNAMKAKIGRPMLSELDKRSNAGKMPESALSMASEQIMLKFESRIPSQVELAVRLRNISSQSHAYYFFGLSMYILQLAEILEGKGGKERLARMFCVLAGNKAGTKDLSASQIDSILKQNSLLPHFWAMAHTTEDALAALDNPAHARRLSSNAVEVTKILAPPGAFDHAFVAHASQEVLLETVSTLNGGPSPAALECSVITKMQGEEDGFKVAERTISQFSDATSAHEFGRRMWKLDRWWAAELAWSRALSLEELPRVATSLAHVRVCLARRMRGTAPGCTLLARGLLEQAVANSRAALKLDPLWKRGAQRSADALLALGDEHAMEACRELSRALQRFQEEAQKEHDLNHEERAASLDEDACELQELLSRAKHASRGWCGVKEKLQPTEVLRHALNNLASEAVSSLGDQSPGIGKRVADAVSTIAAISRAGYFNPVWKLPKTSVLDMREELRRVARCVKLNLILESDDLRRLVFLQEPWSCHGLHTLDQSCVSQLPLSYEAKEETSEFNESFREAMARQTGDESCDFSMFEQMMELLQGSGSDSKACDETPVTICAFSCTLLLRLVMAESCSLSDEALRRLIELHSFRASLDAGGEYLNLAFQVSAGIAKYGIHLGMHQFKRFFAQSGSIRELAKELVQGDKSARIQKTLADLTVDDWLKHVDAIPFAIAHFVLPAMDGRLRWITHDASERGHPQHENYKEDFDLTSTARIFLTVLKTCPQLCSLILSTFRDGDQTAADIFGDGGGTQQDLACFRAIVHSSFGQFFLRQGGCILQRCKDSWHEELRKLMTKWLALPVHEKSGYRWESLPNSQRLIFEDSATSGQPLSKKEQLDSPNTSPFLATAVPSCASCGRATRPDGSKLLKCSHCRVVKYCSTDCQKQHWTEHRVACESLKDASSAAPSISRRPRSSKHWMRQWAHGTVSSIDHAKLVVREHGLQQDQEEESEVEEESVEDL